MPKLSDPLMRLLGRIEIDPTTGCWVWQGYVRSGYGIIGVTEGGIPSVRTAHRIAYERLVGPVPEGLDLDHLCHTRDLLCPGGIACPHRRCVNPDHLEPVTRRENAHRGRGRHGQTHCKWGHEMTPENTMIRTDGAWNSRRCRVCLAWSRRRRRAAA